MGITAQDFEFHTVNHYYRRQYADQLKLREHDEAFAKLGTIDPRKTNLSRAGFPGPRGQRPDGEPHSPRNRVPVSVKVPKGLTAAQYAMRRISEATPTAVEKLIFLMQNSRQENIQYNAAVKLLALHGIVEIEKSVAVVVDAEAIIRELNRTAPPSVPIANDQTPLAFEDATITEDIDDTADTGGVEGTSSSGPEPTEDQPDGTRSVEGAEPPSDDRPEYESVAQGPVVDGEGWGNLYPRPGGPIEPHQAVPGQPVARNDYPRVGSQ
jgi:hypothetical protein